jgi:hypothetical protein
METRVKDRKRSARFVLVATVAAGFAVFTLAAAAASLGGINQADLYAQSNLDTVDLPLAFDHFDDCGGALNGDVDVVGNTWIGHSGNWRCQPNNSRATQQDQSAAASSVTVGVGQSNRLILSTYMSTASRTATGAGSGVSLLSDGTAPGNFHMYVVYQRGVDQVTLGKVDSSGDTEIVSISLLPRRDAIDLVVEIDQPDITIKVDGVTLTTYTMSAGEIATFGSNTRLGMETDIDRRTLFEWFQVEAMP